MQEPVALERCRFPNKCASNQLMKEGADTLNLQPLGPWTLTECNCIYSSTVQAWHACTLLKYFHFMLINLSTPPYIAEGNILFFTPQHLLVSTLHKKNMIWYDAGGYYITNLLYLVVSKIVWNYNIKLLLHVIVSDWNIGERSHTFTVLFILLVVVKLAVLDYDISTFTWVSDNIQ